MHDTAFRLKSRMLNKPQNHIYVRLSSMSDCANDFQHADQSSPHRFHAFMQYTTTTCLVSILIQLPINCARGDAEYTALLVCTHVCVLHVHVRSIYHTHAITYGCHCDQQRCERAFACVSHCALYARAFQWKRNSKCNCALFGVNWLSHAVRACVCKWVRTYRVHPHLPAHIYARLDIRKQDMCVCVCVRIHGSQCAPRGKPPPVCSALTHTEHTLLHSYTNAQYIKVPNRMFDSAENTHITVYEENQTTSANIAKHILLNHCR